MKKWIVKTLLKCQWFKECVMDELDVDVLNETILRLEEAKKELACKLVDALTKLNVAEMPKCSEEQPKKKRKYTKKK